MRNTLFILLIGFLLTQITISYISPAFGESNPSKIIFTMITIPQDKAEYIRDNWTEDDFVSSERTTVLGFFKEKTLALVVTHYDFLDEAIQRAQDNNIKYIIYNNEEFNGPSSTPKTEVEQAPYFIELISDEVHMAGLEFISAPSFRIMIDVVDDVNWNKVNAQIIGFQLQKAESTQQMIDEFNEKANIIRPQSPDSIFMLQVNPEWQTIDDVKQVLANTNGEVGGISVVCNFDSCTEQYLDELFALRDNVILQKVIEDKPPIDSDGDGIDEILDLCPLEPETFNDYQDTDGCPDSTSIVIPIFEFKDTDGDRIQDGKDQCVDEPEDFNGVLDWDGCPENPRLSSRGTIDSDNDTSEKTYPARWSIEINYSSKLSVTQTEIATNNDLKKSEKDEHVTRPTFGLSHQNYETIVDNGFRFNNQTFTITDNFHTPFAEQSLNLGEVNSFEAKVYAEKGLKVQEFIFGIPNKGDVYLAELGIEVWYDYDGEIENINVIQKSNVIDSDSIIATHEKTKCQSSDIEEKCDTTNISIIFLEPLNDKIMALKAIDYENRYQITYLNEGVDISGESLNPMKTVMISSTIKGEGLIQVTQTEKYSLYWIAEDGRMFERNDFGSFKQINKSFKRFQDSGEPLTRYHSGFGGALEYEKERALNIFNATTLLSPLHDSYSIEISIDERITDEVKEKMAEQEQIAQNILEDSQVQARYSQHS